MNSLIKINYDNDQPTVLGRDLHEALGVKSKYADWFKNMCAYGFDEHKDFSAFSKNLENGGRTIDHQLTIPMAKELCMLQRSEKGKEFRKYFIKIEEQWNTPEAVMARALKMAMAQLEDIKCENKHLSETVAIQTQQIAELQPKATYYDVVLNCKDVVSVNTIAKDYGKTAQWLNGFLHDKGIQYKQGKIWLLYQKYANKGYTKSKTCLHTSSYGTTYVSLHTYWTQKGRLFIYELLKANGILPEIERESSSKTA